MIPKGLKKHYYLHSLSNRLVIVFLPIMMIAMSLVVWYEDMPLGNRIGIIVGVDLLFLFLFALFLWAWRLLDKTVFTERHIKRVSLFRPAEIHDYSEYFVVVGEYRTSFGTRPCIILTPKKLGRAVAIVDTGKYGNHRSVNKAGVIYTLYDESLANYLKGRRSV